MEFYGPFLSSTNRTRHLTTAPYMQREPWRWNTAMFLSLVVHALLLSVALGGQSFGLPGLKLPWQQRPPGANELRILLAPPKPAVPAPAPEPVETPVTAAAEIVPPPVEAPVIVSNKAPAASAPPPAPAPAPLPAPAPPPEPGMKAAMRPEVNLPVAPDAPRVRAPATAVTREIPTQASEVPIPGNAGEAAQKQAEQEARERALEQAKIEQKQSAERLRQAELIADARREASRQEQLRQDAARAEQAAKSEAAKLEAERQELARQEAARQDAAKQEAARQFAAKQEAQRQETMKQENARQDAARQEAARQDAIKQEAARQEAAKQEAARQVAAKQEAARQDALRQEAARQDAVKQEAARQDAAKQAAARQEQEKRDLALREKADQEAKREERLRAIGRQLDSEAAQRDTASKNPTKSLLPGFSTLRRGWLLGRSSPNADLVQYAEAMGRKIEMNTPIDIVRQVVKQPHTPAVVTMAIRADGSVEKVTFEVSSGVPAIDEAIRNVLASHAPYGAFPPGLARQYDVIEIRRTWVFDTAIRLQ